MSDVNLEQDPQDFMGQAKSEEVPADPNGQPKEQDPAEEKPAEEKPAEETPKVEPETKLTPEPAPEDPKGQPTKTVEELTKDQEHANKKISELGQAKAKLLKTNLDMVNKNPDLIKDIHESDPETALHIVKEKWGYDSYEELMAHARIDELKETDPDGAKREEQLLKVTKDNATILKQLHTGVEKSFYDGKGILDNPFDPKYQAVQEGLKKVSKDLVKDNYAEALELAHTIAFPARTDAEIQEDQKKILLATGNSTPEAKGAGGSSPSSPSTLSESQAGFANLVGAKV